MGYYVSGEGELVIKQENLTAAFIALGLTLEQGVGRVKVRYLGAR